MITYDQMVTEVTLRLGNRQDLALRIGRWINYAYFEILLSPRFSFKELDTVTTFETHPNQSIYQISSIATDYWFLQDVRDSDNQRRIRQIHWQVIDDIQQTTGQPTRYALYAETVILDPIPDDKYVIQVRYRKRPIDLISGGDFSSLGSEWEEPFVTLSYVKGCEALELQDKANAARALLEPMLAIRQDVPMLEDEDSDFGLLPSLLFRQTA